MTYTAKILIGANNVAAGLFHPGQTDARHGVAERLLVMSASDLGKLIRSATHEC